MEPTQGGQRGKQHVAWPINRSGQLRKNRVSGFTLFFRAGIPAILLGVDAQVITNQMIGEGHIKRVIPTSKNGECLYALGLPQAPRGLG